MVSSKIRWYYGSTANYQCSNIITSHLNMNTIVPKFDTRLNHCMIIVRCTECLYWFKKLWNIQNLTGFIKTYIFS